MKLLFENWREYLKESSVVDIDDESGLGNVYGVVHYNMQNVMNWAEKHRLDDASVENIIGLDLPIAILKNINVEEEARGQGVGGQLMDDFMSAVADEASSAMILIADMGEIQDEGFNLEEWYKGYDFETVGRDSGGNPVMVKYL